MMQPQRATVSAQNRNAPPPRPNKAQAWLTAVEHHQAGRLDDAKAAYKKIARIDTERTCYALNNLGLILSDEGNPSAARMLFARSASLHPNYCDPLNNLGNLHRSLGEFDAAVSCFQRAKLANPAIGLTYLNLGSLFESRGQTEQAIDCYRDGTRMSPQSRECHLNLGAALERNGQLEEATAAYEQAVAVDPKYVDALNNLGTIWKTRGDFGTSLAYLERALAADPAFGYTYLNLGYLYESRGQLERAITAYKEGLRLTPESAEGHLNLGGALQRTFLIDEAIECYQRAIALKPDFADAHSNLGIALKSEGKFAQALVSLADALRFQPDHHDALMNLGNTLTALGRFDEAAASYERVLVVRPDKATARSNMLLALNYPDSISALDLARHSFRIAAWMDQDGLANRPAEPLRPARGRRLRVGYVSPDFRRHATNYFFESLLQQHNRDEVEIYCYAGVDVPDAVTARFQSMADHWRSTTGVSDNELAAQIRADGINVLVDIAGHSGANRLPVFARRPAPVQMTWLGYPGTTGMKSIDYRIVDAITDPAGESDGLSSETLLRIEGGFLCYMPPAEAPEPVLGPCATNRFVTFGSFNNLTKLSDATLSVWGQLLARVPTARLLLKSAQLGGESRERILGRFRDYGIPAERMILLPGGEATAEHLASYRHIDIALDPFPYNGTTTTCETLWMGVPTVVLLGDSHRSRVGASLLTRVGCGDLIARDHEDYIRIAAELAVDPLRQQTIRQNLRARMAASSLCDAPAFARKMEAQYRTAWDRWCEENDAVLEPETVEPICVRLKDGTTLHVPASLDAITTYVVLEQQQWFEKETDFVRRWLRPGMTAIDIGANLGIYSLPMARAVAPDGKVFAYEPAAAAFGLLTMNGADNLVAMQLAISDRARAGYLSHASTCESNRLCEGDAGEAVGIVCLDDEDAKRNWNSPDFVKIDTVGNEPAVLHGGTAFFARHSPLVMFAVKNENADPLPSFRALLSLGYSLFRLLPGAAVLVPADAGQLDAYELNLFAARPDRAATMARDGWLVGSVPAWMPDDADRKRALHLHSVDGSGAELAANYLDCLAAFLIWRSPETPLPLRCAALDFAFGGLVALNRHSPTWARLLTLGRVASEAGHRAVSVQALRGFLAMASEQDLKMDEPFWAASARFDDVNPEDNPQDWIVSSAVDQIELSGHFSSIYTGATPELKWLSEHNRLVPQTERRRALLEARATQHSGFAQRLTLDGNIFRVRNGVLSVDTSSPANGSVAA